MKIIEKVQLDEFRWAIEVDGIVRRVFHDEEECRRVKEAMTVGECGAPAKGITLPEALQRARASKEGMNNG